MSTKGVVVGLLAGAAAGAVLGVLLAPEKGAKTRRLLRRKSVEVAEAAKEKVNAVVEDVAARSGRLKEEVTNLAKKSKNALDGLQA